MTAGKNDDPFAYLYRPDSGEGDADGEAAEGGTPAQPGVPRTSYNQVQRVGERRQAPQQQTGGYGYPPQQPSQYGQQPPATQAMPQQGGYGDPGGSRHGGPPGRGPNSRGLLIAAVTVVAAVAIGIGVAIANGDGTGTAAGDINATPPAGAPSGPGGSRQEPGALSPSAAADELPRTKDAATLNLSGGAVIASDVKGAKAAAGNYVTGMNAVGASASWTFHMADKGSYRLYVTYSVPGTDSNSTITVNGKKQSRPLNMENYSGAPAGDWEKGWTRTWGIVDLKKGQNTVSLSCEAGNTCDFYLDQVWLARG